MTIQSKLEGTRTGLFKLSDNTTGAAIKDNSGILEARLADDSALITMRVAQIASGAANTVVPTLIDLQGAIPAIGFGFAGASAPAPGTNTGKWGFCHTDGGGYTAGDIVKDTGTVLLGVATESTGTVTSKVTFAGSISMTANELYSRDSAGTWAIVSGAGSSTGNLKIAEVPYTYTDSGTPKSSTATLPDGARVYEVRNIVTTLFGGTPAVTVTVGGGTPVSILAAADSNLAVVEEYIVTERVTINTAAAGTINVSLTGATGTGVGVIAVTYTDVPLS